MSQLWVRINYVAVASLIKSIKGATRLLEASLEKAVKEKDTSCLDICVRKECPLREKETDESHTNCSVG